VDDPILAEALTFILTRMERIKADAADASNIAFATRCALSAALKESNPELEKRFQFWIEHFQPLASKPYVDDQIQAMLHQLSSLLPK
jgi:hypothetical protein